MTWAFASTTYFARASRKPRPLAHFLLYQISKMNHAYAVLQSSCQQHARARLLIATSNSLMYSSAIYFQSSFFI